MLCSHWQTHILCTHPVQALCPLSVPHPHPPVALSPWWRCVLSCSDPLERAGLARGRAGGKKGPHPWKLRGDAVAPNGNIYGQVNNSTRKNMRRCMCLNSDIHSRALFIQIPEFSQASDNMLLLMNYYWYTSVCFFWLAIDFCDACAGMFLSLNLLWLRIHIILSIVIRKWVCT